jgi:hypothetical protein
VGENFSKCLAIATVVSANASTTEPAHLLAVFVLDTKDTVLTTPDVN